MAQVEKRTILLTPRFRVAFPQITELKVFQPGQKGRYSCVALFTPANFTDKEKQQMAAVLAACNKVSLEAFKKDMKVLDRSVYKTPFHKGEEKEQYAGFGKGVVYCTMSAYTRQPKVLSVDGQTYLDPNELYPGCFARASINPFANVQWKSISIGMNHLQKMGEGERLDGSTSAEEDFGSDPVEYDDADLGGGDGGSTAGADDDFAA